MNRFSAIFRYLGTPTLSTSLDHQSTYLLSNETLPKFAALSHLNEIYDKVRSNDKIFTEKIHYLLNDIDQESEPHPNQSNASLTLQSQMMLARNLAHTLTNNEPTKTK